MVCAVNTSQLELLNSRLAVNIIILTTPRMTQKTTVNTKAIMMLFMWARRELNPRPFDYESTALTA